MSLAREGGPALEDIFTLRNPERLFEPNKLGRDIRHRVLTGDGSVQPRYAQALTMAAKHGYAGLDYRNLATIICRIATVEIALEKFFKDDDD